MLTAAVLIAASAAFAEEPSDIQVIVERTINQIRYHRSEIARLEGTLAKCKNAKIYVLPTKTVIKDGKEFEVPLKKPPSKDGIYFASEAQRQAAIKKIELSLTPHRDLLKKLESGEGVEAGMLPYPPKLNSVGQLPAGMGNTNIRTVIDDKNLLARCYFSEPDFENQGGKAVAVNRLRETILWVKGVPTKGAVDGLGFSLPQIFKVTDTKKHPDVGTVFVVEPIDLAAIKAELAKAIAKLEAAAVPEPQPEKKVDEEKVAEALYAAAASREALRAIIEKYPSTAAAKKAKDRLAKLEKK